MNESPPFTPLAPPANKTARDTGAPSPPPGRDGREPVAAVAGEESAGTSCLLVTRDERLTDHVALIAAASGTELVVERALPTTLPGSSSMALLGPDAAMECPAGRFPVPIILIGFQHDGEDLWRAAARDPDARVAVLPEAAAWLGEYLGERALHSGRGRVTVFSGATGGAGTTTLAVLSGLGAGRRGVRSLLVDADPHSRGLWPLMGRPSTSGVGWEDFTRSRGRIAPGHLAEILPTVEGTAVLTWTHGVPETLGPATVNEVIAAARRTFDVVVVDAGRTAGLNETLASLADSVLVVAPGTMTTATSPGPPDGDAAVSARRLVVTGRLPTGLDATRMAAAAGLELLGCVPASQAVSVAAGEGQLGAVLRRPRLRRRFEALVEWSLPPDLEPGEAIPGSP